jgi:CRP-like cAMP-binding protein
MSRWEVPMSKLVKYYGVSVKKGEYIFREDEPADVMYMIHKGRVQISKGIGTFDEKIRILGEGEFVGEMAVINSVPRSASAIALEDCILIKMNRESFDETVNKNHEFSVSVIKLLSERLRETDELLMVYAKQDRTHQLLTEVLSDMLKFGRKDASGEWWLLKKDAFIKRANVRLMWEMKSIVSVLNDLIVVEKLKIKKDQTGTEWLAFHARDDEFLLK